jgi:hypothetical protein
MPVELRRRRFTVDEYYAMADAGILTEDDRVELIEGEIVQMASPKSGSWIWRVRWSRSTANPPGTSTPYRKRSGRTRCSGPCWFPASPCPWRTSSPEAGPRATPR